MAIDDDIWAIRYLESMEPSGMSTIAQRMADEIERLRAGLADVKYMYANEHAARTAFEAKIVRVKALCADLPRRRAWERVSAEDIVADILAAIEESE